MISILLPAYNAQTTISSCLKSIQRQHFKAWRCVVVDDGSSDNTASIVREFQTMDTRFELIEAPHRGLVPTLQFGLQHCTAPFVARMDADDIMHSNRLKLQLAFLRQNEALAAVGCQVRIFPRESLKTGLRDYESWLNALCEPHELERDAYIECPVAHPSLLIRTEVLRAFGYRNQDWPEDYDLVLRLLLAGQKIANLPSRLLCWRNEPNRMSMTDPVCGIDRFVQCKAHFLCEGFLKKTDE